jgi:NhaP-type Na+/H+ or K+/H+ antiporter
VLAALFHSVLAVETAAQEGKKVILVMLATGGVFICVIALGELAHWAAKQRRR